MSWQSEVYQWLRLADREWVTSVMLFDEVRDKIPLHAAMRHAHSLYGPDRTSGRKAQWLYFTQMLKQIGVERDGDKRYWQYVDKVRLQHVGGQHCRDCGGPVIYGSWSGKSLKHLVCLACEAAATEPHLRIDAQTFEQVQPGPDIDAVPKIVPQLVAEVPQLRRDAVPKEAAPPERAVGLRSREQTSLEVADKTRAGGLRKAAEIVPPYRLAAAPPLVPPPVRVAVRMTPGDKAKGTVTLHCGGKWAFVYRRTLARELKPILRLSLNRIERELERNQDNLTRVLALHGKTTGALPMFFFGRVTSRAVWERMRQRREIQKAG